MRKRSLWHMLTLSLCVALLVFAGVGCKSKKGLETINTNLPGDESNGGTGMENTTTGEGQPDIDQENLIFDPSSESGLKPIYFDFDSSTLRPDALATLRNNAEIIKNFPNVIVQVAGHCDERGTQEYNLALGERRALCVREHLMKLGVSGDRMITISYGEEFPAVQGNNEAAWSQNRRAEFHKAQSR